MKERPILFSAPMVRAILAGAKTQTRRIVKPQPTMGMVAGRPDLGTGWIWIRANKARFNNPCDEADLCRSMSEHHGICPYGEPGDRLWVKETIDRRRSKGQYGPHAYYRADDARVTALDNKDRDTPHKWKWQRDCLPCIHMPRGLSRITLEVTSARVERLKDITEDDARAEGCSGFDPEPVAEGGTIYAYHGVSSAPSPVAHFRCLWESINGERAPFGSNPFVWRVEFKALP